MFGPWEVGSVYINSDPRILQEQFDFAFVYAQAASLCYGGRKLAACATRSHQRGQTIFLSVMDLARVVAFCASHFET